MAFLLRIGLCSPLATIGLIVSRTAKLSDFDRNSSNLMSDLTIFAAIDGHCIDLFDCWADNFLASGSKMGLHVTTLDNDARKHLNAWEKAHARSLMPRGTTPFLHRTLGPLQLLAMKRMPPRVYTVEFWRSLDVELSASSGGVLHSDVDAFIIRNPDPPLGMILQQHHDVDIVTEVAYALPRVTVEDWGFAINIGFTIFRRTDPVRKMVRELLARTEMYEQFSNISHEDFYEQTVLNEYLQEKGCEWTVHDEDALVAHLGQCGGIKVAIIGDPYVNRRSWMGGPERFVLHPFIKTKTYLQDAGVCQS